MTIQASGQAMTAVSSGSGEMTADQAFDNALMAADQIETYAACAARTRTDLRAAQAREIEIKRETKKKFSDPGSEFFNKVIAQQDKLVEASLYENVELNAVQIAVREYQENIEIFEARISGLKARHGAYEARVLQQGNVAVFEASLNVLEAAKLTGRKIVTIHNHA